MEHDPTGHSALVGEALTRRGVALDTFRVVTDPRNPVSHLEFPDAADYDVIVVLGAVWSVYDEATIGSWIGRELDFVREAHRSGKAVLGLCFGGQVLSAALGGEVSRAPEPEFGWQMLDSDRPDDLSPGPWFQWHYDRFSVPPGGVEIARNANGSQAFLAGRSLGLQFHPELDEALLAAWLEIGTEELAAHGLSAPELAAETTRRQVEASARAGRLVDWFLDDVAGR